MSNELVRTDNALPALKSTHDVGSWGWADICREPAQSLEVAMVVLNVDGAWDEYQEDANAREGELRLYVHLQAIRTVSGSKTINVAIYKMSSCSIMQVPLTKVR